MSEWDARTRLLLGDEAVSNLKKKRVAVFGIGGVGGYVCEALVRSGIGAFDLIDKDTVSLTNLNRQIIATRKTLGRYKTEVMKERMAEIQPDVDVYVHNCFFLPENADAFDFREYDYVVDAVDTVTSKIEIVLRAKACGVPVISAMGAGNKTDPTAFRVADLYDTSVCPLARIMRRECRRRGIESQGRRISRIQPRFTARKSSSGRASKARIASASSSRRSSRSLPRRAQYRPWSSSTKGRMGQIVA